MSIKPASRHSRGAGVAVLGQAVLCWLPWGAWLRTVSCSSG